MDQALQKELFEKINGMALLLNTLITEFRAKETMCADHKKNTDDHEMRIRTLELASANVVLVTQINKSQEARIHALELKSSSDDGANTTSHNWRDTLIQALTMGATIAGVIYAVK